MCIIGTKPVSEGASTVTPVIRDAGDRRALVLAAIATVLLVGALLMPMAWAVIVLVALGIAIGAVAVTSGLQGGARRHADDIRS